MNAEAIPELEVVAIRTAGPHEHISGVKLADGRTLYAADVIEAIQAHRAHYVAQGRLIEVRQCPDCLTQVLWS